MFRGRFGEFFLNFSFRFSFRYLFWNKQNFFVLQRFRKILVSVKFVSAILGPEMGAPILWTPGKNAFFLQEKPCP